MAFGQQSGPPASAKQVQALVALLTAAGHSDFRDARGPMGFTQRQAGGKFTRDEADAFIARLESAGREPGTGDPVAPRSVRTVRPPMLDGVPAEHLAEELRRRGWTATPPVPGDDGDHLQWRGHPRFGSARR